MPITSSSKVNQTIAAYLRKHEVDTIGDRAIAGIRSEITRKIGDDYTAVNQRWIGDESEFWLADDQPEVIEALEAYFDG